MKFSLQNLALRKLWASFPSNFNDPFEFRISRAATIAYINSISAKHVYRGRFSETETCEELCHKIESELQKFGVTCFTENPTDILMWSHYADHHRGICLCFDLDDEAFRAKLSPVIYSEDYPTPDLSSGWQSDGIANILITKSRHWAYEKEFRGLNTIGEGLFEYPGRLSSVIFGYRCGLLDRQTVMSILATEIELEYFEAELSPQFYEINLKKIEL